jgi:peptide/nickel transport system substrate-binding protein
MKPVVAALLLAVLVAGCRDSGARGSGGTFRLGTTSGIDSLNPYVARSQDARSAFTYIYPFLVQYDKTNLQFAPDFATSWSTSGDGLTWTFETVRDAKWSDGASVTAADAAWSINTGVAAGAFPHVDRATATNPHRLVVRYDAPVGNALAQLQQLPILPRHIWEPHAADLRAFPNTPPVVGAGPFELAALTPGQVAVFHRDDDFYGDKPMAQSFELWTFAGEDELVAALRSKVVDAIEGVPPVDLGAVEADGFIVSEVPGVDQTDLVIRPHDADHPELGNRKVRQAFDNAINRRQIVHDVFLGTAQPAVTIVPEATGDWFNPNVLPQPYLPRRSNQLLDSLGFGRGADGIRVANGRKMSYELSAPAGPTFDFLSSDFRRIGVELRRTADSTAALALSRQASFMDPDFVLSSATCGRSESGFCDRHYDEMYAKQQLTPDDETRKSIVWEMQRYLGERRPYLWIAALDHLSAVSKGWTGLVESPQGPFNSLSKLSLTSVHRVR